MIQPVRSVKVTKEFLKDGLSLPPFEGGECFRVVTFTGNDWEERTVTIQYYSSHFQRFNVVVPKRLSESMIISKVQALNPNYRIALLSSGYNGDDFVYDRLTFLFAIVKPEVKAGNITQY